MIKDYVKGVYRKGRCAECGHEANAVAGCQCNAEWCPCHAKWKGHKYGAHSCKCR